MNDEQLLSTALDKMDASVGLARITGSDMIARLAVAAAVRLGRSVEITAVADGQEPVSYRAEWGNSK